MRRAISHRESGQTIVLILIVVAIVLGGWWYLKRARDQREVEAQDFAKEAATRIVLQHDMHFLNTALSQTAQALYPPSWRERMMDRIKEMGAPQSEMHFKGEVHFNSGYFDPEGEYLAGWNFARGPGSIDIKISHPQLLWQIDGINWTWNLPPPPTPSPTPTPTPSPRPIP